MIATYRDDPRIIVWDLYNEPTNVVKVGTPELLENLFDWARSAKPIQPLTVSIWGNQTGINRVMLARSDVVSYHLYGNSEAMRGGIARLKKHGRPVLCTEWMARALGSNIETDLPLFKREEVGCYMWGLVNGRSQFQFPWWNKPNDALHETGWFHDILHKDGTPYRPKEIEAIRKCTIPSAKKESGK